MLKKLKQIYQNIRHLNSSVDNYKDESIIQSLPSVAYVNKAIKLIKNKKYDEAQEILESALDISSQDSLVYKYLGKIAEYKKDFKKAVENYEISSKLNDQDKEIWLRLGMCRLYSNMLDEAIEAFTKADKIIPLNTDVYTGWGMVFMKQKKYALARDKFNYACKISKYNYTAILLSAVMEMRLQDYNSAEEKLNFLVKVAPNESSFYEYSRLKLIQNKFEEAEKYALKAININKLLLPAYFILGEVYSVKKDIVKLEQTFNSAVELGLDSDLLYFEWGKAYIRFIEFAKAREQFEKCLSKNFNNQDARIGLALINAYEGDFILLDDMAEKNMQNVYIQEGLGVKYLKEGKYDDAVEMLKKALKTDKNQISSYYALALVYMKKDDNYKVREYFDKLLERYPNYLSGLIEYTKWLINVSDFEEAQRKINRAEKLDKNNVEILNLLFLTQYTLVKKNICEYNIKEAISVADKASGSGRFDYGPQRQELEQILKDLQGKD